MNKKEIFNIGDLVLWKVKTTVIKQTIQSVGLVSRVSWSPMASAPHKIKLYVAKEDGRMVETTWLDAENCKILSRG